MFPGGACVCVFSLTPCALLSRLQAGAPWPEAWRSYREASCGAVNLGRSCFLNAALQALVPVWYNTYGVRDTPAAPLAKLAVEQMERLVHGVSPSRTQCSDLLLFAAARGIHSSDMRTNATKRTNRWQ